MNSILTKERLTIIKELGKGKSGVSYLVESEQGLVVLKIMHQEVQGYYRFTQPKITHEVQSYTILSQTGISIPRLLSYSHDHQYLIKQWIPGLTGGELLHKAAQEPELWERIQKEIIPRLLTWARKIEAQGLTIDYFPSNFVISDQGFYYIDYEHNKFSREWCCWEWGIWYWLNPQGFQKFLETGDGNAINLPGTPKPQVTQEMEKLRSKYDSCRN